jgi:integrase
MTIPMPKLTRRNGDWFSRKAIPADIREAYRAAHGVSQEARFRLPSDLPAGEAKKAYGEWVAEVEGRISKLRAAATGRPVAATQRELQAIAGRWYGWFTAQHEAEPSTPEQWENLRDQMEDAWSAGLRGVGHPTEEEDEPIGPAHRRRIRAKLTELSRLPSFLAAEGVTLTEDSMDGLLDGPLPGEFMAALGRLARLASGNFEPDTRHAATPRPSAVKLAGWTVWDAFTAWANERKPAAQTLNRWHGVLDHLHKFVEERDVALITEENAVAWKDALVASGNAQGRTINEVWLTAARTVFSYIVAQKRLTTNPFAGVKVATGKKVPTKGDFTPEEQKIILSATLGDFSAKSSPRYRAAFRWVPWLCAYTGSRPGEITQLRRKDIAQHPDGYWLLHVTMEAGTVKGAVPRTVVLHEHLIEQGFIDFVRKAPDGPLFYDPSLARKASSDPLKPVTAMYVQVRNGLGEWVRELGVVRKDLSPSHSWRHTFKRRAMRAGIEEVLRDAICGHTDGRAKAVYETPSVEDIAAAIARFPRYEIDKA